MAGIQAGTAYIPVKADMSQFGTDVKQGTKTAEGSIKGFAKRAGVLLGGAFAASKAKDFFGTAISGARDAIAIDKQTEAVIKSTGGAAGVTAEHVDELANKLQKTQTINDEVTQSGANLLLTFKNIRNEAGEGNDVFDKTVALANDMSVAMGQDMKSSSILLGKALNDPKTGLSALTRVGVTFTEQQKEQIAALVESGDTLGAQKVIMGELEDQFGGSAAAQADAGKKMALAWDDFQEVVGRAVIPIVDRLLGVLTKLTRWAVDNPTKFRAVAAVIGGTLVAAVTAYTVAAIKASIASGSMALPILAVGAAVAALAAGAIWAYENIDAFRTVVDGVAGFLQDTVWPIVQAGAAILTNTLIPAISNLIGWFGQVITKTTEVATTVGTKVGEIVGFVTGIPSRIASTVSTLWDGLRSGISEARNWVSDRISEIVGFVLALPGRIARAADGAWTALTDGFKAALNVIIRAWNRLDFSIDIRVPGWVPGVGGKGFQVDDIFPDVPTLHSGGVFRAPPGQREGLALLLDGERVLSPSQTRASDQGAGALVGGDFVVQVLPGEDGIGRGMRELQRIQMMSA